MKTRHLLATAICLSMAGCNYSIDKSQVPGGERAQTDPKNPANLSFANVLKTSLAPNCLECHASPRNAAGINLETYENVFSNRAAIAAAVQGGSMPKGRSMPTAARALLLAWIEAGAPRDSAPTPLPGGTPQTAPSPGPAPRPAEPDPANPSNLNFQTISAAVLQPACIGCHSSPDGAGGVALDTYEGVFASRTAVASAVESDRMPRRRPLTPNQKALLLNWLAAGAPRDATGTSAPPAPSPRPSCDDHRRLDRGGDDDRCEHSGKNNSSNLEVIQ